MDVNPVARAIAERVASLSPYEGTGRPSELGNARKIEVLLTALLDGCYRQTACSLAGISKQSFYNWDKLAKDGFEPAVALFDAVENVEAMAEHSAVRNVRKAGEKPQFWAASATWLERKAPDRWGRRNDDTTVAKVIFQLGAKDSDITIVAGNTPQAIEATVVSSTPAPTSLPALKPERS